MTNSIADIKKKILAFNTHLPRYTSYPSSPHFYEGLAQEEVKSWYQSIASDSRLSLYIHIPFCRDICWYCGCHTQATRQDKPILAYLEQLYKEIEMVSALLPEGCSIEHIHFGGGSPTILSPAAFRELDSVIRSHFPVSSSAGIAIEIDPRHLTEAKIAAYVHAGINRASLGVQDFDIVTQRAINRFQPLRYVYKAVQALQDYGINAINFDLIYGLPYQTLDSFRQTIDYTLLLKPQRIALFGYAHVPWMKKHMRLIDESSLPDAATRLELFDMASQMLLEEGYTAVGIDHFVRADDPMLYAARNHTLHRNFQGYTTDIADALLGLGVSAISRLPQGYLQQHTDTKLYYEAIRQGQLPYHKGFHLQEEDQCRSYIIERLMCDMQVDFREVFTLFPAMRNHLLFDKDIVEALQAEQLIMMDNNKIIVHPQARQIVRKLCAAFDNYYGQEPKRHSQIA